MCNLYQMTPEAQVERYLANLGKTVESQDYDASRPVAPFGAGLFLRSRSSTRLLATPGQWGMIRPGQLERVELLESRPPSGRRPSAARPRATNNARIESVASKPTFAPAWRAGRRCLIPADWYAEPNWESGKNVWWHLKRADQQPWFLAGLWSEWVDPSSGVVVPNFTMLTCNCDAHPLLARLHKPDPALPADRQDKRSLIHIPDEKWDLWLQGTPAQALELIRPAQVDCFDLGDARRMDDLLRQPAANGKLF